MLTVLACKFVEGGCVTVWQFEVGRENSGEWSLLSRSHEPSQHLPELEVCEVPQSTDSVTEAGLLPRLGSPSTRRPRRPSSPCTQWVKAMGPQSSVRGLRRNSAQPCTYLQIQVATQRLSDGVQNKRMFSVPSSTPWSSFNACLKHEAVLLFRVLQGSLKPLVLVLQL